MDQEEIRALFDQQAAGYDAQWEKTRPIRECLYLLLGAAFADLPDEASVLCVGLGTGQELAHLAQARPGWRFTAVEPSGEMLRRCRALAEREGFAGRCVFHEGYLDSLPEAGPFDAATCFLVSQFLLDRGERVGFFRGIAQRLRPGGLLASTDLAADIDSSEYAVLLQAWARMMAAADVAPEAIERMRRAYGQDVAVLPPAGVEAILREGGFPLPVRFFQAGLIHGWLSRRCAPGDVESAPRPASASS